MTDTPLTPPLIAHAITDERIAAINQARTALTLIEACTFADPSPEAARVAEACDAASNALFRILTIAHVYARVPMSDAQLHNPSWTKGSE